MTRLLVIGNSHVAALKAAHVAAPARWPGLRIAFAGAPGGALETLQADGPALQAVGARAVAQFEAVNGTARFPLGEVDAVVITGCEVSMFRAVALLRRVIWPACVTTPGQGQVLASREFVREAMVASLRGTLAARLVRVVRAARPLPVIVTQQPNPCWLGDDAAPVAAFLRARKLGYADRLARLFAEAAEAALAPEAAFLPQPVETLRGPLFTRPVFSQGSVRLSREVDRAHETDDYLHANAAYGALVLDSLAGLLQGAEI